MDEKEKRIQNLKLKCEGTELEYQYVNQLKDERIRQLKEEIKRHEEIEEYYKKELEQCVSKMEKYKIENETIKNSKWWKLREKLRGGK